MLGHSQLSLIPVSGDLIPCPRLLGHPQTYLEINNQNQVSVFGLPIPDINSEMTAEQVAKEPLGPLSTHLCMCRGSKQGESFEERSLYQSTDSGFLLAGL